MAKANEFTVIIEEEEQKADDKYTYEVLQECGTYATKGNVEYKLRLVSWNKQPPKYELRGWIKDKDGNEKCARGGSWKFTGKELLAFRDLLNKAKTK